MPTDLSDPTDAPAEVAETTAADTTATTTDGSGDEPTESSAPAAGGFTGLDPTFGEGLSCEGKTAPRQVEPR